MASDIRKGYTLRLELRDDSGTVVGEVSAKFSGDALRGLIQEATSGAGKDRDTGGSRTRDSHGRDSRDRTESGHRAEPRAFHGRDENPTVARGEPRSMSREQRKFLFRLAYNLGFSKDVAANKVLDTLGVDRFEEATHSMASRAIDTLKQQVDIRQGSNGAHHH